MKKIFNHTQKTQRDKITAKAMNWLVRVRSSSKTPATISDFYEWLAENPIHEEEFDMVSSLWDTANLLDDHPMAKDILSKHSTRKSNRTKSTWFDITGRWLLNYRFAVVAATFLIIVGSIWLTVGNRPLHKSYHAATGEQKTIELADGSTVQLDSETRITTFISKDTRRIELLEGRASFSVFHEPERPFFVLSGQVAVMALGTKFNVYKASEGKIYISVTQGYVQISDKQESLLSTVDDTKPESAIAQKPLLRKKYANVTKKRATLPKKVIVSGQEITVDERKASYEIKPVDTKIASSWQEGRLYFNRTPLKDVVNEINRYLDKKIRIADPRLNDIPININFDISYRKYFLQALESSIPIASKSTPDGWIAIYQKETEKT